MIDPCDLNPELFENWKWRGYQGEVVDKAISSSARHLVLCLPTGAGKSILSAVLADMGCSAPTDRALLLTSTKALQDQYNRDFPWMHDFRGRANYKCNDADSKPWSWSGPWTCQDGQELGMCKSVRDHCCTHQNQLMLAQRVRMVIANYAAAFSYNLHTQSNVLLLDEAHDAIDQICEFNAGKVYREDVKAVLDIPMPTWAVTDPWIEWAGKYAAMVEDIRVGLQPGYNKKKASRLAYALNNISNLTIANSVLEQGHDPKAGDFCYISPVWPHNLLKTTARRIYWVSATITQRTMDFLGIPPAERAVLSYPSPFPLKNRPVYIMKCGVRVDSKAGDGDLVAWVDTMDQIIKQRQDRKGIIHVTSYRYADVIEKFSDFKHLMHFPKRGAVAESVAKFKAAKGGAVLVSPAVSTGWDFPMDDCRYQIISKVPFPDTRSPLARRRSEDAKDYGHYCAMMTVVQAAGRGVRTLTDKCETFLVDDHFRWWWGQNKHLAPAWFVPQVMWADATPPPMIL